MTYHLRLSRGKNVTFYSVSGARDHMTVAMLVRRYPRLQNCKVKLLRMENDKAVDGLGKRQFVCPFYDIPCEENKFRACKAMTMVECDNRCPKIN